MCHSTRVLACDLPYWSDAYHQRCQQSVKIKRIRMKPDQFVDSTKNELPSDIRRLVEAIKTLPPEHRDSFAPALDRVVEGSNRRRQVLLLVQDSLAQLRLDMKYLMFDLEATRRERDAYRKQSGD